MASWQVAASPATTMSGSVSMRARIPSRIPALSLTINTFMLSPSEGMNELSSPVAIANYLTRLAGYTCFGLVRATEMNNATLDGRDHGLRSVSHFQFRQNVPN